MKRKKIEKFMLKWKRETLKSHLPALEVKGYMKKDVRFGRDPNGDISTFCIYIYKSEDETYQGLPIIFPTPDNFVITSLGEGGEEFLTKLKNKELE